MDRADLLKWFKQELIPEVVKSGHFADEEELQKVEKCEFEEIENYVSSFASAPSFAKLILETPAGYTSRDILVKFQHQEPLMRAKMKTTLQYFNEVFFYNAIIPQFLEFLLTCGRSDIIKEITPRCYFASHGNGVPEKAVVVLEDLRSTGYRLSHSKVDLDLRHCLVSIEALARFHAVSFAMKYRKWVAFDTLKSSFIEVLYTDDMECRTMFTDFQGQVVHRGIDYLLTEKRLPEEYLENFRKALFPIFDVCKGLNKPTEPLAVICHGDFNRNNILYKYSNGQVVSAKLIDFQRYLYASPCLDLGLLIYLNTSLEVRNEYFYYLFDFYYQTVVKTVSDLAGEPEMKITEWIPIGLFREDFGRVAAQHYVVASFFLPIMMSPPDDEFENDMKYNTDWENGEKNLKKGGEAASRRLGDIIVDFYNRGFYR